jgi:hypothetical protein
MPGALGNKNALGNKGGGRKSAYQENADATLLREMFLNPMSREEIQAKLKSGKYSLKDLFVSKGYSGNERVLLALFHKYFPDDLLANRQTDGGEDGKAPDSVKNVDDVMVLIEDTINSVRAGTMSVQAASNISRLASLALKGIEVGELDKKMDLVNSVINDRRMKTKK